MKLFIFKVVTLVRRVRREMTSVCSSSNSQVEGQTLALTTLIPNLPNDISSLILSFIPFSHHSRLKPTCKSWKHFFSSKPLNNFSLRQKNSHILCLFPQDPSISPPFLFDPKNLAWRSIPPMPCNSQLYGLTNFISIAFNYHLYVIGGSLFDARSFPMDRPSASASIYRFDMFTNHWVCLSPMLSARGSFACAAVNGGIIVAGGGSRHAMFGAAGSRMSSVERYDVEKNEWVEMDGLPRFRAGCVGFLIGNGEEMEFWVMGGYGESRTVSGVFPVDEYYRDGVVLELKSGGKWREIENMWEEGERRRLGNVVVLDGEDGEEPGIFMLDGADIFRYDISSNRWQKESSVPRTALVDFCFGFAALDGELHVLSPLYTIDSKESRRPRLQKKGATILIQIYHPKKRAWRSMTTKPPSNCSLDFKTVVMCTIRI